MSACTNSGAYSPICPSLFNPTAACDGKLARIRVPGGILDRQQCLVLTDILTDLDLDSIDITNRANLQIRGLKNSIPPEMLLKLESVKLAGKIAALDRFRNIMASPTAGIDCQQLIDTRPLVRQLDEYLASDLNLTGLSPKFSIGLDGGESVSIEGQSNDILLKAVTVEGIVCLHLYLAEIDPKKAVNSQNCLNLVRAIAQIYLDTVPVNLTRKPRLKQIVDEIGIDKFIERLEMYLFPSGSLSLRQASNYKHLGIHPQIELDYSYIGIALPLGRLKLTQLRGIAEIIEKYGNGTLRLTPWRSILLPAIPNCRVSVVERELEELGLSTRSNNIWGGLIACSGTRGCAASFTDTQADALAIAESLADKVTLNEPTTIHLSGCSKSCAHQGSSHLTLVGTRSGYDLYAGDAESPFGKRLLANLEPERSSEKISQILCDYQREAEKRHLSWQEFADRWRAQEEDRAELY